MCSVGTYLSVAQKASEYIFHDLREKKKTVKLNSRSKSSLQKEP